MSASSDQYSTNVESASIRLKNVAPEEFHSALVDWYAAVTDSRNVIVESERLKSLIVKDKVKHGIVNGNIDDAILYWPEEKELNLGAKLTLISMLVSREINAFDFANTFFPNHGGIINGSVSFLGKWVADDLSPKLMSHMKGLRSDDLFSISNIVSTDREPIQEDIDPTLTQYNPEESDYHLGKVDNKNIPAADRVVSVNHNSPAYDELDTALDDLQAALEKTNLGDSRTRVRATAEVSSGRRLLQATAVRLQALAQVLLKGLKWIAVAFLGSAIEGLATRALEKLLELIPALSQLF
jgi:hypothetical protein